MQGGQWARPRRGAVRRPTAVRPIPRRHGRVSHLAVPGLHPHHVVWGLQEVAVAEGEILVVV